MTEQTRRESHKLVDKQTRYLEILGAWAGEMTAREIGYKLGYSDLNAVKPRITELVALGKLEECGKKWDTLTRRNVTVWRVA